MGYFSLKDLGQYISLQAALEYLARRNWTVRRDGPRIICEGPLDDNQQPIVKFLPAEESFADYPLRLEELIATLSLLEERPALKIACDMAEDVEIGHTATDSLMDAILEELKRNQEYLLPGQDIQRVIDELRPLIAGAEHETQQQPISAWSARQQAALLASRFAKLIVNSPNSQWIIWRLSNLVLLKEGLQLQLLPEQLDEFYSLARADNPDDPEELLLWINKHSISVMQLKRKQSFHNPPR